MSCITEPSFELAILDSRIPSDWNAATVFESGLGERCSASAGLAQTSMLAKPTPSIPAAVQGLQPGAHCRIRFRSHSLASPTAAVADRLVHGTRRVIRSEHQHAIDASATGSWAISD